MVAFSQFAAITPEGRGFSIKCTGGCVGSVTLLEVWPNRRISPTLFQKSN